MAIKDSNSPVYGTIPNELKEKLAIVAEKNHRSMSKEVAHALTLYLKQFNDDGTRRLIAADMPEAES